MKTTSERTQHDWSRFDETSEAERRAAALADPDAQPLTQERLARMKRTPQVKVIRRTLGLSQEEFAARFHVPLSTLRDWEQGRKEPDAAARAYLVAIGQSRRRQRRLATARPGDSRGFWPLGVPRLGILLEPMLRTREL